MARVTLVSNVFAVTDAKSLDTTEDSFFVFQHGAVLYLMVADGAPQRLETTESLKPLLSTYGAETKPGRYAALLARDVCARLAAAQPTMALRDMVLEANRELASRLKDIYGAITAEAVRQLEPSLSVLSEDPRYVRWILPVACLTLARIDLRTGRLAYAHCGDTALFALYRNGRTVQVTPDQMVQHDDKVRSVIARIVEQTGIRDFDLLQPHLAEAWRLNQYNGIFHNYVDERGRTDLTLGCGVINGLPELEAYLITGELDVHEVEAVVVCSDGCFWPNPLGEQPDHTDLRIQMMGAMLRSGGLRAYIKALRREEASDADGAKYLRFGTHDDATALMVYFDPPGM